MKGVDAIAVIRQLNDSLENGWTKKKRFCLLLEEFERVPLVSLVMQSHSEMLFVGKNLTETIIGNSR